jgi:hypothetical protein
MARQKERGRRHVYMTTASESFGQPVDLSTPAVPLRAAVKLDFLFRYFSQDRHAVLDTQTLDLSVSQIGTKTNEKAPRGW